MTNEPSHDPTDDIIAELDAGRATPTVDPLMLLAGLSTRGEIDGAERDAGVIFHQLARASGDLALSWRSADGKWSIRHMPRMLVAATLKAAREAVQNEGRLQALNAALAAEEPTYDPARASRLSMALGDLVKHWWGSAAVPTHAASNGVVLAGPANDNDPTPERQAMAANDNERTADGAWRLKDWPLARMHKRGQLDPDPETNDVLFAAGMRYAQDVHLAGMSASVASPDYAKPVVDGGTGPDAFSERRLARLRSLAKARWVLGTRYVGAVDAVVIHERTLTDASAMFGGERDGKVVARERLNEGLRRLAVHYGQMRAAAA